MAESTSPDTGDDTRVEPDRGAPNGISRPGTARLTGRSRRSVGTAGTTN